MKNLASLYFKGNPFIREFKNYRKRLVSTVKTLTYLDGEKIINLKFK